MADDARGEHREDTYRLLAEATAEGVALHEGGRIVAANPAFEQLFGYGRGELIGMDVSALAAPESRTRVAAEIAAGREGTYEAVGLRKDGSTFVGALRVRVLRHDGRVLRGVTIRDLTERNRVRAAFDELTRRVRTVVENAPIVLFATDRDGVLTLLEGREVQMLGVPPGCTGTKLLDHFRDEPEIVANLRRALAGEELASEVQMRTAPFVWDTRFVPLRDAAGQVTGVLGVATNITARRRAERERDRLLAEEKRARALAEEALAVREEFLSVASHELNSPLTALKLRLQEVARAGDGEIPPERLRKLVEVSERQLGRLTRLVADLLDVSRISSGQLSLEREELELGELARETAARVLEETKSPPHAIEVRTEGPVRGRWDRVRIEQVLTNLLSNALKYGRGQPVDLSIDELDGRARLAVHDRGIGIPSEVRARLFQRFGRGVSARRYGGLGLGLYIVRQILEAHGGEIRVDSAPGEGTTFTVLLPR